MDIAAPSAKMSFPFSIARSAYLQDRGPTTDTLPEAGKASVPSPSVEFIVLFSLFFDTIIAIVALFLAAWNHGDLNFITAVHAILAGHYSAYILVGSLLYLVIFGFLGGYNRQFFLSPNVLALVFKTSSMWLIIFLALALALKLQPPISRYFFVWAFLNSWVLLSSWRLALRQLLLHGNWMAMLRERVLVVGWSKESDLLARRVMQDSEHHYEIIGCTPSAHGKFWVGPPRQVPVLGDYNSLEQIIDECKPSIVIIADLDPVMGEIIALAELCEREHVQFKVIPSYFQTFTSGLHLEHVSGVPVLGISKLPLDHVFNRIVKRAIDVVGSIVGLILSTPLIFIFGYLIQRESPGPIFYSQIRMGKSGKEFRIYKLRSMRLDAETAGVQWTTENDPRRLKIGEFIRKWNIDEVPQFWNVLLGDMSLVGPRPERPEHIERLKEEIRHYNARHYSKPGLTGFAQVNGMRGDTDLKERIRYDLYYLENWTAFMDIYIMIRTFFTRSGAY